MDLSRLLAIGEAIEAAVQAERIPVYVRTALGVDHPLSELADETNAIGRHIETPHARSDAGD